MDGKWRLDLSPHDDDALAAPKEELRTLLGHASWDFALDEAGGLPSAALDLARLACMDEQELYGASAPLVTASEPTAIEFVSAPNERLALLLIRERLGDFASPGQLRDLQARIDAFVHGGPPRSPSAASATAAGVEHTSQLDELARALRITHKVRLVTVDGAGRGLVASRSFATGECVLSIPVSELVCAASACAHEPWLRAALGAIDEGAWTAQLRLMIIVLRERRRAADSRWRHWLESLPPSFADCAQWAAAACTRLPAGAYWVRHALVAELSEFAERLLPELCATHPRLFPAGVPSAAEWLWARGVVATRAIELPLPSLLATEAGAAAGGGAEAGADEEAAVEPAIVPLMDMLNHSPRAQLEHRLVRARPAASGRGGEGGRAACLELRALTPIGASEPLLLDYGSGLGPSELLLQHGIGPEARVEGRPFCVQLQLPEHRVEEACVAATLLLAQLAPGGADTHYLTENEPLPPPLLLAARLCCLAEDEVKDAARAFAHEPVSAANDRAALRLLEDAVSALLEPADPYGVSQDEPDALDAAALSDGPTVASHAPGEGEADGCRAAAATGGNAALTRAIDGYCDAHVRVCKASLAQIRGMLDRLTAA